MTVIAHISDLHFGAEDAGVVAGLRRELNRDPPDLVAISGDLTQGGRRREFQAARAFIDSLASPVLAVPGNHDITPYNLPERFLDPYARWRDAIAQEVEPVWRDGRVAVLGLNTAHRAGLHWDWSRGRVTPSRLRRLLLRSAPMPPGLVRVVVAHHPFATPEGGPRGSLVGGARKALAAFADAGIGLILSGHVHRSFARAGSRTSGGPMIVQAATATSVRLRGEPNAYNRIAIDHRGRIDLEVRLWRDGDWVAAAPDLPRAGSTSC
jgi:3',5'-cyclic AMP phosphodiesterase CpdA